MAVFVDFATKWCYLIQKYINLDVKRKYLMLFIYYCIKSDAYV